MPSVGLVPAGNATAAASAAAAAAAASAAAASADASASAADAAVAAADAATYGEIARTINLFDAADTYGLDSYWNASNTPITLSNYYASRAIPVTAGQAYTINNCRGYQYLNSGVYVTGSFFNNATQAPVTFTIPGSGVTHVAFNVRSDYLATCQLEQGSTPTTYTPYGMTIGRQVIGTQYLDDIVADLTADTAVTQSGSVAVYRSGDEMLIRSAFDESNDIVMPVDIRRGEENQLQFASDTNAYVKTVATTATDSDVWPTVAGGTQVKSEGDDNAPFLSWGGHVGGNHGWLAGTLLTAVGHGKTTADRGSTWTDGTRTYTIIKIVSTSQIWFAGQYSVAGGIVTGNSTLPSGTLTHVAGATNTGSITIAGGVSAIQIHPVTHSQAVTATIDGRPIPSGKTIGDSVEYTETYTIVSYKGLVDWSQAHIGSDPTNLSNLATMPAYATVANTYRISAGCQTIVSQKITAVETIETGVGVTQVAALQVPSGGVREQFMAGVGTAGGQNWSTLVDISSAGSDADITPAECVSASYPADRMVQWVKNSGGTYLYGLSVGYLPYGGGSAAERLANASTLLWQVRGSSRKNYPQVSAELTLNPGETSEGTAWRRYLPPTSAPAGHVTIDDGGATWAVIDRVATTSGATMRAPQLVGRRLRPVGAVTVTAPDLVAADGIRYAVASSPGYGMWQAVAGNAGTRVPVPASATSPGSAGDWAADASYLYICTAVNTWRRAATASW